MVYNAARSAKNFGHSSGKPITLTFCIKTHYNVAISTLMCEFFLFFFYLCFVLFYYYVIFYGLAICVSLCVLNGFVMAMFVATLTQKVLEMLRTLMSLP